MADCLDNTVGVRGCGSGSALAYINDLTGISVADMDQAVNPERKNGLEALNSIIQLAQKLTLQSMNQYYAGRYKAKSFIDNDMIGYYYDDKVLKPAQSGYLVGYEIRIDQTPFLELQLESIRLFCDHNGDVDVKIYDLIQGKLMDTVTLTAIAGQIVEKNGLGLSYATKRQRLHLFIGYASEFGSYNTSYMPVYNVNGLAENCNTCTGSPYKNRYMYFRSAQIAASADKIRPNVNSNVISGGAGLSFGYSLKCSFIEHLCNMRQQVALPIMYKAGELVMKEFKHSKRLNSVVTLYGKDYEALELYYHDMHEKLMAELLQNGSIPDSVCFGCNPQFSTPVVLP